MVFTPSGQADSCADAIRRCDELICGPSRSPSPALLETLSRMDSTHAPRGTSSGKMCYTYQYDTQIAMRGFRFVSSAVADAAKYRRHAKQRESSSHDAELRCACALRQAALGFRYVHILSMVLLREISVRHAWCGVPGRHVREREQCNKQSLHRDRKMTVPML